LRSQLHRPGARQDDHQLLDHRGARGGAQVRRRARSVRGLPDHLPGGRRVPRRAVAHASDSRAARQWASMNHARLAPLVALLGFATLSACDPELDDEMDVALDDALELDDVPFDLPAELEPIDSQLDELQAEADDQQTVNGCLSAPQTYFVANKNEMAWATFQVNAPYSNDYDFEVTPVAFYDQLSSWMIRSEEHT